MISNLPPPKLFSKGFIVVCVRAGLNPTVGFVDVVIQSYFSRDIVYFYVSVQLTDPSMAKVNFD